MRIYRCSGRCLEARKDRVMVTRDLHCHKMCNTTHHIEHTPKASASTGTRCMRRLLRAEEGDHESRANFRLCPVVRLSLSRTGQPRRLRRLAMLSPLRWAVGLCPAAGRASRTLVDLLSWCLRGESPL